MLDVEAILTNAPEAQPEVPAKVTRSQSATADSDRDWLLGAYKALFADRFVSDGGVLGVQHGRCPICGHDGCFDSTHIEGAGTWSCFSDAHPGRQAGNTAAGGTAIDYLVQKDGMTVTEAFAYVRGELGIGRPHANVGHGKRGAGTGVIRTYSDHAPTVAEICDILRKDSRLNGAFGYNVLGACPSVRGVVPWADTTETRDWTDVDDEQLFSYMQAHHHIQSRRNVQSAFTIVCSENSFNPIMDMLDALPKWDGTMRADRLFTTFLGAADGEYEHAVARLFLQAAVKRVHEPGCKYDYVPICTGAQGLGKSELARRLAMNDAYFNDGILDFNSQAAAEGIRGIWIAEIPELAAFNKTKDNNAVKAFVTRTDDVYRTPYDRRTEHHKRMCVIIANTNKQTFLTDPTGNRRFMPVRCDRDKVEMDIFGDGVGEYIHQVWAEILHEYRANPAAVTLRPSKELELQARDQQNYCAADDPWVGFIQEYADKHDGVRLCAAELLECSMINIGREHQDRWQIDKVHELMANSVQGWKRCDRKQRCGKYGIQTCYEHV